MKNIMLLLAAIGGIVILQQRTYAHCDSMNGAPGARERGCDPRPQMGASGG
jgi:hypothetical protein